MTAKTHEANFWQLVERMEVQERHRGERSRALPRGKYGDPAKQIRFGQRAKGGEVDRLKVQDRLTAVEIADDLICQWYRWEKPQGPNLAPKVATYCNQYNGDERHNDSSEEDEYAAVHRKEMEGVAFCIYAFDAPIWQAIHKEMRNRQAKAQVWRSPSNVKYTNALHMVMARMRTHEDLSYYFCG